MPLQPSKNAAYVIRLLLQRQAPMIPFRHAYMTSTVWGYSEPSSVSTSPASVVSASLDPFLEDEDPTEYEQQRSMLPDRISTARPIPWPTVFEHTRNANQLSEDGSRRIPSGEQHLPCTPLSRLVSRKDYDGALNLLRELRKAGVPVKPRDIYARAARSRLIRDIPDKDGFLAFFSCLPEKTAVDPRMVLYLRERHTGDVDFFRQIVFDLADRGLMTDRCMALVDHLALVARPEVTLVTFMEALDKYRLASRRLRPDEDRHDSITTLWNRFIRRMVAVGHRTQATEMYHKLSTQKHPIKWDPLTEKMIERPSFERVESFPQAQSADETPVRWLTRRMRYAKNNRVTPADLHPLLAELTALASTHPTLYNRFRASFVRARVVPVGPDGEEGVWTVEQAQRVWVQAEIIMLQRQERHDEAICYFRGHCLWYGLPLTPEIEAMPIAANTFNRELRPNIAMINLILRSIFEIIPRTVQDMQHFHKLYFAQAPSLSPAVQPDSHTHGMFAAFMAHHFGIGSAVAMLQKASRQGLVVGSSPFERLALHAARRGNLFEQMDGLLRAMENGTTFAGVQLGTPDPRFYVRLRAALAAREAYVQAREESWAVRRHSDGTPTAQPVVTLRKATHWSPEWAQAENFDDEEGDVGVDEGSSAVAPPASHGLPAV